MTYTCPMHEHIKQDEPGRCPECNMELVADQTGTEEKPETESTDQPAAEEKAE